ncbi:MAG: FAD-binding oxidoreductase [Parachlamydiaceae bacterium]|nr:FAD-binding oxidoreductase [Parachlamydiaceae bacterium]
MFTGSSIVTGSTRAAQNPEFLNELTKAIGLKEKEEWQNNNSTLHHKVHLFEIKDVEHEPSEILSKLYELKKKYRDQTFVASATAGWKTKKTIPLGGIISDEQKKQRMDEEYGQSFSLSEYSTGTNEIELKLRVAREAQKIIIKEKGDRKVCKVTGGVRITDVEKHLSKLGYATSPNMSTLQFATFAGLTANGGYGPSRELRATSTNIIKMKIVNPLGRELTLSDKRNPKLFKVLRDCHIGVCFVKELSFEIEPKFLMKRHNRLFNDVPTLRNEMTKNNFIDEEHFIAMYIPVDIEKNGDHFPRIRIINLKRTDELPEDIQTEEEELNTDYFNLMETEIGEEAIKVITKHKKFNKYSPFIHKSAAIKTYGTKKESVEINYSRKILHPFKTYTDEEIRDVNFLIQVENVEHAREVMLDLLQLTEDRLKEVAKEKKYPLLNAFGRYLKGIYYPEGEGGIAPTAVEKEHQSILSFEFVSYEPHAQTKEFKDLVISVQKYLDSKGLSVNYHPGKHFPEDIHTLNDIYKGKIREQRLKNFQEAVYTLHEGDIEFSTLLSSKKKEFIGLKEPRQKVNFEELEVIHLFTKKQEKDTLQAIFNCAIKDEELHAATIKKVEKDLNKL